MTEVHAFTVIGGQFKSGSTLMRNVIGQRSRSPMGLEPYGLFCRTLPLLVPTITPYLKPTLMSSMKPQ